MEEPGEAPGAALQAATQDRSFSRVLGKGLAGRTIRGSCFWESAHLTPVFSRNLLSKRETTSPVHFHLNTFYKLKVKFFLMVLRSPKSEFTAKFAVYYLVNVREPVNCHGHCTSLTTWE